MTNVKQLEKLLVNLNIHRPTMTTIQELRDKIENLEKMAALHVKPESVQRFEGALIIPSIECNESLDVVKYLPEFNGEIESYVSWQWP